MAIAVDNPFFLPRLEIVIPPLLQPTQDILGTGSLLFHALRSMQRVILGFLFATAVAIPIGIGMGLSEKVSE
ncbi:MAG TPA: ABC transporter permease, partial [Methanomicrobiales archaeon]|nr:ABC transporter permease [Methanomicrobiales archaeon]